MKTVENTKHVTQFQGPFCHQRVISYHKSNDSEHSFIFVEVFLLENLTNFNYQTHKEKRKSHLSPLTEFWVTHN